MMNHQCQMIRNEYYMIFLLLLLTHVDCQSITNTSSTLLLQRQCAPTQWNGLNFPLTLVCNYATVSCADSANIIGMYHYPYIDQLLAGTVRYKCQCGSDGGAASWDTNGADASNCTHRSIDELRRDVISSRRSIDDISSDLNRQLSQQPALVIGDIGASIDIIRRLLPIARREYASSAVDRATIERRAITFIQTVGAVGDQLLADANLPIWMQIDASTRVQLATDLMTVLEDGAGLLADHLMKQSQTVETFNYHNWAMRVQVFAAQSPVNDAPQFGIGSGGISLLATPQDTDPYRFAPINDDASPLVSGTLFGNYSNAPTLSLPSLNILQDALRYSPNAQQPQDDAPSRFGIRMMSAQPPPTIHLGTYLFTNIGALLLDHRNNTTSIINSHVIGATVNNASQSLQLPDQSPATFTFYHLRTIGVDNARCVYWNTIDREWNQTGCRRLRTSRESTDCECNHLTSFAILMDITGSIEQIDANNRLILDYLSLIGCAISIVCLIISLVVFTCFRSLSSNRNTIHRNLCLCLLIAQLLFIFGIDRTSNAAICSSIAIALHYFLLAAFCWMLLEGYQLYLMLIQVFEGEQSKRLVYHLFAYGFPAIVVALSAGMALPNYGTEQYCWLDVQTPIIWAFVGPISVIITANIIFLIVALKVVLSAHSHDRTRAHRIRGWIKGSSMLLCLLGIGWIFGYFTAINPIHIVFAYAFTILNSLQGLFIFVLHVLMNEKVRLTLKRCLVQHCCCQSKSIYDINSSQQHRIRNMMSKCRDDDDEHSHPSTASTASSGGGCGADQQQVSAYKGCNNSYEHDDDAASSIDDKTNDWMNRLDDDNVRSIVDSKEYKEETQQNADDESNNKRSSSCSSRVAPVRRKKFPLGATIEQRGHDRSIIIERF